MARDLVWKDTYCVGNEMIDREHKRLFEIANTILSINNPLMDTHKIRELIKELYRYMQEHFDHEESHMADNSFEGLGEHKAQHEAIIQEMNSTLKQSRNYIDLDNRLVALMKQWVLQHIIEEDVKHCLSVRTYPQNTEERGIHSEETSNPA